MIAIDTGSGRVVTHAGGVAVMAMGEAATQSIKTGQTVELTGVLG